MPVDVVGKSAAPAPPHDGHALCLEKLTHGHWGLGQQEHGQAWTVREVALVIEQLPERRPHRVPVKVHLCLDECPLGPDEQVGEEAGPRKYRCPKISGRPIQLV